MKCAYSSSRLLRSLARCCARNCTCWVSHDAVKDVRPPIVDPASAAKAERYAGSMMQSPHRCLACHQRLRVEEGPTGRETRASPLARAAAPHPPPPPLLPGPDNPELFHAEGQRRVVQTQAHRCPLGARKD